MYVVRRVKKKKIARKDHLGRKDPVVHVTVDNSLKRYLKIQLYTFYFVRKNEFSEFGVRNIHVYIYVYIPINLKKKFLLLFRLRQMHLQCV